jgi:hypothetical protein
MRENSLQKIMLERGMKGYDATFISGFIAFSVTYLITNSFIAAISFASYFWALTIVIFICYHFEIGSDYYRKVKNVALPKGNKFINLALSVLGVFFFTLISLGLIAGIIFVVSFLLK